MVLAGLDVSKISTALCIECDNINYLYSYTSKKENNIWVKNTKDFINYRFINYTYNDVDDYSKSEMLKLIEFDDVTDLIIKDLVSLNDKISISIEGYSYSSKKGPIFDLIEFTTLLKHKLIKLNLEKEIEIISPLTLKVEACKMVYEPRIELKGKKVIKQILHNENNKGKEATKFDKWDMLYAFIDSNIKMNLKDWCKTNIDDISKNKEVPKPIDDIIDSIFLKEYTKIKKML
jgi:hypothetical protein